LIIWEFVLIGSLILKFVEILNSFIYFAAPWNLRTGGGRTTRHPIPHIYAHATSHTVSRVATAAFLATAVTTLVIALKFPTANLPQPNAAVHTLVLFDQLIYRYIMQCYGKRIGRSNFNSRVTSDRVIWPY
jgi:hypothetical protein